MTRYDPLVPPEAKAWLALDEETRIALIEDYHREAQIDLPDVQVHSAFHCVVETQIAMGEELPVKRTAERLIREGLDRHDAVHAIGSVLAEHVYRLRFDADDPATESDRPYYEELEGLTAAEWLKKYGGE